MSDFIEGAAPPDPFDPDLAAAYVAKLSENKLAEVSAVEAHLRRSQQAYRAVFVAGNPTPDDLAFVMHDLAWFCKAHDPQWNSDPRMQDRMVARREVYQRIVEYTALDHITLVKRYAQTQG